MKVCAVAGLAISTMVTENTFAAAAEKVANSTALHANFQQKDVHGTVKDAKGTPLPGVTVMIKGSAKGTQTDASGHYKLAAKAGDVLVFRFVGFAAQEITVGSSDDVSVSLLEGATGLNELVVTALGIKRDEKAIGYAMTKVKGSDFTQAREINVANALVGKVAGVNSTAPATGPGGSSRVNIRGVASLQGNIQPLYVVNGVPYANLNMGNPGTYGGADMGDGISNINPDDIEDMTVLKGGAAAALYGSRALGGVILITTKSGKLRKGLGIEVNSNYTVDKIHDFRDFQTDYGQGTLGVKPTDAGGAMATGLLSWGAKLDGSATPIFNGTSVPYSNNSKNHLKDFYRTGSTVTNTVAMSGGNENTTFRLSLGDLRNLGVYPGSYYKRNNASLDLGFKLSDKWSGSASIMYTKERANRSNVSDAPANGNFAIMFLPNNVPAKALAPGWDPASGFETEFNSNQYNTNPYFAAAKATNLTTRNRVTGTASLKYQALDWLSVQGRLSNDYYTFTAQSIWPYGIAFKHSGKLVGQQTSTFNELNAEGSITANKKLGNISLNVTAGGNFMRQDRSDLTMNADGLAYKNVYNPGTGSAVSPNLSEPTKEIHSVFGSAEVGYKNMLFLNLTDRNDWSSTLPKGNNSYNYPSASISYLLSENLRTDWLTLAKIRAGVSQVGGDAEAFKTQLYYSTLAGAAINGQTIGNMPTEIANKELKPLQGTEIEAGTQLAFFKNRLSVDFAWYKRTTKNDIVASTVSSTSGFATKIVNFGEIQNKGIELLVSVTPVKLSTFSWTTSFNYTHNQNTVMQLTDGLTDMQMDASRTGNAFSKHVVGMSAFQIAAFDYARDNQGNLLLNASGVPTPGPVKYMGSAIAPNIGGWNNEFNYKRFGLAFLIDFKSGGYMYSGTNANAYAMGLSKETLPGREGGVKVTGIDPNGNKVTNTVTAQNYYGALSGISALQVYKSDFIKFRSVSLTYNFPASAFNNKISGLSLSLVGRNLFYISKHTPNIDPESSYNNASGQGLEYAGVPTTSSYGLNLNVKF